MLYSVRMSHMQMEVLKAVSLIFPSLLFLRLFSFSKCAFNPLSSELSSKAVSDSDLQHLTVQHELAEAWESLAKSSNSDITTAAKVHILPSIQHAVDVIQAVSNAQGVDVLVAGSLHLVGGVFEVAKLQFAL